MRALRGVSRNNTTSVARSGVDQKRPGATRIIYLGIGLGVVVFSGWWWVRRHPLKMSTAWVMAMKRRYDLES